MEASHERNTSEEEQGEDNDTQISSLATIHRSLEAARSPPTAASIVRTLSFGERTHSEAFLEMIDTFLGAGFDNSSI